MDHLVQVIDCMSHRQVKKCLEKIYQRYDEFQGAPVHNKNTDFHVDTNVRSNTVISLNEEDPIAMNIGRAMGKGIEIYKERLLEAHQSYDSFPLPDTQGTTLTREHIQVLKYEPGQRYKWHTDQFPDTTHNLHNRSLSLVLYLTNNFSGGRTCLPHRCYKPRPGQALIFPSNWCFPHSAEPVTVGTKIACVGWYHSHYSE